MVPWYSYYEVAGGPRSPSETITLGLSLCTWTPVCGTAKFHFSFRCTWGLASATVSKGTADSTSFSSRQFFLPEPTCFSPCHAFIHPPPLIPPSFSVSLPCCVILTCERHSTQLSSPLLGLGLWSLVTQELQMRVSRCSQEQGAFKTPASRLPSGSRGQRPAVPTWWIPCTSKSGLSP